MIVIGLWLAIVGYGVAYAGMRQLAGDDCSVIAAFRGRCDSAKTTAAMAPTSGTTLLAARQSAAGQQASMIGQTPIPQVA